jgi:hypothetical protein
VPTYQSPSLLSEDEINAVEHIIFDQEHTGTQAKKELMKILVNEA